MATYLLTGASRGIGLELAVQLAADNSTSVIAVVRSISTDLANLEARNPNVQVLICDISSAGSISSLNALVSKVLKPEQKITHVINNAAILAGRDNPVLSLSVSALTNNITTNVVGPSKVIEAILPFFPESGGVIINMTSGIASLQLVSDGTIPANISAYSISKCALNMLTVHLAQALKGRCRVICLDPGHVKTQMGGDGAVVEVNDSAKGIRSVIQTLRDDKLDDIKDGRARFLNFQGQEIPW